VNSALGRCSCREDSMSLADRLTLLGPPPLARGRRTFTGRCRVVGGTTPARAGKTRSPRAGFCCRRDHPRSRGEDALRSVIRETDYGPPPLARGRHSVTCNSSVSLDCFQSVCKLRLEAAASRGRLSRRCSRTQAHRPHPHLPTAEARGDQAPGSHRAGRPRIELGTNLTLTFLRDKRAEAHRIQQRAPIHLGLPAVGFWNGS
jgi:hypothetical protein